MLGLAGLVGVLALHLHVVERTGGLEKRHEVRSIGNFGGLRGTGVRLGGELHHGGKGKLDVYFCSLGRLN